MKQHVGLMMVFLLFLVFTISACQPIVAPTTVGPDRATESAPIVVVDFEAIAPTCADGTVVLSDSSFHAGSTEIVEIVQEEGERYFTITAVSSPVAYPDSTLVEPGEGVDTVDGGFFVIHHGSGTGSLAGTEEIYTATPPEDGTDLPCEPVGPVAKLQGIMIIPEGTSIDVGETGMPATRFEAIDIACADGGVVLSAEPMVAGRSEVSATQEPDDPFFLINSRMFPTAYPDGSWEAPGAGFDKPDGTFMVLHQGHGVGELEGSRILFTVVSTEADDLPCEPVGPVVKLAGVIIHADAAQ
ncbi:MAG: hypothetical protein R3C14_07625 [Caldilineaceae bacterium]